MLNDQPKILDMNRTLEENEIIDDFSYLHQLEINESDFVPTIFLYYNDDLNYV